jgi:hypothetical protein
MRQPSEQSTAHTEEEKRSASITLRATPEFAKNLALIAEKCCLNQSELIRRKVLEEPLPNPEEADRILHTRMLRRIDAKLTDILQILLHDESDNGAAEPLVILFLLHEEVKQWRARR